MKWILPFAFLAGPALAETCPVAADHSAQLSDIVSSLQLSRGAGEARVLTDQLWELWTDAPDQRAQSLLDQGMQQRSAFNLMASRNTLDQLVEYCPDYAEGYNQRAFSNYLQQNFEAALVDLDRAIALVPNHIAAISGRGLTLMGLGRHDEAQEALRAALALNPWLAERNLSTEPIGTDI